MRVFLVKARRPTQLNGSLLSPEDGWAMVIDVPLSDIPSKHFSIKKPKHTTCPRCQSTIFVSGYFELNCLVCDFESDWVYARYRIIWRG